MDEQDFTEMIARMVMSFSKERERGDTTQQAVESVVQEDGRLNGDNVPKFLRAYNAEMRKRDVDVATRLEYFCRVVAVLIHKEVKELREAHDSWLSFEEALLMACGYEKPNG